ncbi:MAG: DUF1992 domain-containing protein [Paracoccaceae bacterium]
MDHPLISLIDDIVAKAEKQGEFDNLPGAGKPLSDVSNPSDAVLDRMMKEAEAKPLAVVLTQEIAASKERLKHITDDSQRKAEMKVLADLEMRRSMEIEAMKRFG